MQKFDSSVIFYLSCMVIQFIWVVMHVDKKELQRLTSRLATLRRFIARFTNKPRPFFLTLNGASTTSWMGECGQAFEEVKHYLTKPPIPSSPQSSEQLYMYLAISDCVVNAILFRHIGDKEQRLVYYMSKAMVDVETWYSRMEQTVLVMKSAAQKLRSYFQAHQVTVLTNQPLKSTLHKPNLSGWMLKWVIELSEYRIKYQPRLALKWQVMVNFIAKLPQNHHIQMSPMGRDGGHFIWTEHLELLVLE